VRGGSSFSRKKEPLSLFWGSLLTKGGGHILKKGSSLTTIKRHVVYPEKKRGGGAERKKKEKRRGALTLPSNPVLGRKERKGKRKKICFF